MKLTASVTNNLIDVLLKNKVATVSYYSDRKSYDIIKSTAKTMTLRERKAINVKPPKMEAGGFAGVVIENAEWKTESDPNGVIRKATLRKDGKWKLVGYSTSGEVHLGVDNYFYDYSF